MGKGEKSPIIKAHFIFRFLNYMMLIKHRALNFFLADVEKQNGYAMLKLVRISWYRRLDDQRVHINEIFKA